MRALNRPKPAVSVERRPDGALILSSGRLAEEFKLASGTWVRTTTLRTQLIDALRPYVRDLVIAAPDKPWLSALIWLDATACAEAGGPDVWRLALARLLDAFDGRRGGSSTRVMRLLGRRGGSSTRVMRLLPLDKPPSAAAGKVTDKRSINGRRVLERRAVDVARLYAEPVDPQAVVAGGSA